MSNQTWQAVIDLLENFLCVPWSPVEELAVACQARVLILASLSAEIIHREHLQENLWILVHELHHRMPFELQYSPPATSWRPGPARRAPAALVKARFNLSVGQGRLSVSTPDELHEGICVSDIDQAVPDRPLKFYLSSS